MNDFEPQIPNRSSVQHRVWGLVPPAVDELLQDVLGLARKLVAAERLSFGEIAGCEQRLGV